MQEKHGTDMPTTHTLPAGRKSYWKSSRRSGEARVERLFDDFEVMMPVPLAAGEFSVTKKSTLT